jgi:predicted metal-dependent enzyme (double-stranded beta helix superfamily)
VRELIRGVEAVLDVGGTHETVTARLAGLLERCLAGAGLEALFAGAGRSFLAHHDERRQFVLQASVLPPGHHTPAHDHGESWAVYGCFRGVTRYRRFVRTGEPEPGRTGLEVVRDELVAPGAVDVVPAGQVHEVVNPGDSVTWNLVIRPRPLAQVWRRAYDVETGAYHHLSTRDL